MNFLLIFCKNFFDMSKPLSCALTGQSLNPVRCPPDASARNGPFTDIHIIFLNDDGLVT